MSFFIAVTRNQPMEPEEVLAFGWVGLGWLVGGDLTLFPLPLLSFPSSCVFLSRIGADNVRSRIQFLLLLTYCSMVCCFRRWCILSPFPLVLGVSFTRAPVADLFPQLRFFLSLSVFFYFSYDVGLYRMFDCQTHRGASDPRLLIRIKVVFCRFWLQQLILFVSVSFLTQSCRYIEKFDPSDRFLPPHFFSGSR